VTFAADAASNDNARAYSTSRLATLATLGLGLVMSALAPVLVPLLFGTAFRPSIQLIWILAGALIVMVPGTVAGALLVARGFPQLRSVGLILGAVVNAAVLVAAVPSTGAVGAAWATFAGNAVFGVSNLYFAYRHTHARPTEFVGLQRGDLAPIGQALRKLRSRSG
jgi:O-antigen/teichoic acid export membrane protein